MRRPARTIQIAVQRRKRPGLSPRQRTSSWVARLTTAHCSSRARSSSMPLILRIRPCRRKGHSAMIGL